MLTAVCATYPFVLWLPPPHSATLVSSYVGACVLQATAALVEMMGEPMFVLISAGGWVATRALVESGAVVIRCIVTYGALLLLMNSNGTEEALLAFGFGQLAYSISVTGGYALSCSSRVRSAAVPTLRDYGPRRLCSSKSLHSPLLADTMSNFCFHFTFFVVRFHGAVLDQDALGGRRKTEFGTITNQQHHCSLN